MSEKNIDHIISLIEGYNHLFDSHQKNSTIAVYEKGESIKLIKMTKLLEVLEEQTVQKDEFIKVICTNAPYESLDGLVTR